MVHVSDAIESGAIEVVDLSDPSHIRLRLKPDINPNFRQWFHFRLVAPERGALHIEILDVGEYNAMKAREGLAGHPTLWENYDVYASYDRVTWFNLPTQFDGRNMAWDVTPQHDVMYFASFVPYPLSRHHDVLARWLTNPRTKLEVIAVTPDGRDLDLMTIGEPGLGKKAAWITARQHPSETQGPWCVEALVDRLLDPNDPMAQEALTRAVFYVMPNLNPDGTARGHTRTNSHGINLNREWQNPTQGSSPEIAHVLAKMKQYGIDFMLDVHAWGGDKPFVLGPWHIPTERPEQVRLWRLYMETLAAKTSAFELGQLYPGGGPAPGEADLKMSWNYIGEQFGVTAILYELIYKRNLANGGSTHWSVADCQKFGRDSLDAIVAVLREL